MPDKNLVQILLSTYNGERFLKEQLESLLAQDLQNWQVLARDDGSADKTLQILTEFAAKDSRIKILSPNHKNASLNPANLGVIKSFEKLLELSTANYLMFCDQDDVWHPKKISISLRAMHELELKYSAEKPLAVYTDLALVDVDGNLEHPSMRKFLKFSPHTTNLSRLLVQNDVTGCTMLFNRALGNAALPIPPNALMHDWWLALVAASLGQLSLINHPTINYRQHGTNLSGGAYRGGAFAKATTTLREGKSGKILLRRVEQSLALEERLQQEYPQSLAVKLLNEFHRALSRGGFSAATTAFQNKFQAQGLLRTLIYYFGIFTKAGLISKNLKLPANQKTR